MRVVAIGALDQSLIHAMLERHGELGPHVRVAAVTKLGLILGQQIFGRGRMMVRMAIGAGDIVQSMLGAPDVGAREIGGVAREAGIDDLLGLHQGECPRDGRLASACFDMRFGGPMAPLASGVFRRFLT